MNEGPRELASRVAAKFGPFECEACAAEIIKKLGRGSEATMLRIRPGDGSSVIGLVTTGALVSNNRSHVGIRIGGLVFDNFHADGVPAGQWLPEFMTRTGAPLILEQRPISDFFGARFRRHQFRDWVFGD